MSGGGVRAAVDGVGTKIKAVKSERSHVKSGFVVLILMLLFHPGDSEDEESRKSGREPTTTRLKKEGKGVSGVER